MICIFNKLSLLMEEKFQIIKDNIEGVQLII